MTFKGMWRVVFLTMIIFIVAGCSSDKSEESGSEGAEGETTGGELRVALYAQPPTLDQPLDTSVQTRDLGRLMYETLVTTDSSYESVPMLAESVDTSEDGKVYTFHLREGVMFHNGEEMIADDIIASMERWEEKSSLTGNIFEGSKWTAEDDYTVVLELAKPSALALDTMASPKQAAAIMPKEVVEAASPEGVNDYIGTGPFKFEEWKQDQYIHFTKNEDYTALEVDTDGLSGKKEALVDDIYFDIVTDASTRLAGLQTGEYDIAYQIPNDDYDRVINDEKMEPYPATHGELILLYNKTAGVASDFKIREAINTALDSDEIMLGAVVSEDLYWLDNGYMNKDIAGWKSDAGSEFYNQGDTEKAASLLKDAGYDGEELTILTTRDDDVIYNSAVVIQEQLSKAGINVALDVYDWPTFMDRRSDENAWDLFITGSSVVSTPPQLLAMSPTWSGGVNDDYITETLEAIETSTNHEDAKKLWDDVQLYSWEKHLPASVLGGYSMFHAATNEVKGFSTFSGAIFWNTSINK